VADADRTDPLSPMVTARQAKRLVDGVDRVDVLEARGVWRVFVAGGAAGMGVPAVSFLGRAVTPAADTVAATLRAAAGATHPGRRSPLRWRTHPGLRPPLRWRTHPGLRPPLLRRGRQARDGGSGGPALPDCGGVGFVVCGVVCVRFGVFVGVSSRFHFLFVGWITYVGGV
jgi:hypothetical protein